MAVCKLNKNLLRSTQCGYSLPKITDIYLVNKDDISATTITTDASGCTTMSLTLNNDAKAYHIEPLKDSASFEDTLVVGTQGNKYRNSSITFGVPGAYDCEMSDVLDALSLGLYLVVVKTADGQYLAFGRTNPLEAETATVAGGGDNNGITVTLSNDVTEAPAVLDSASIAVILAA